MPIVEVGCNLKFELKAFIFSCEKILWFLLMMETVYSYAANFFTTDIFFSHGKIVQI